MIGVFGRGTGLQLRPAADFGLRVDHFPAVVAHVIDQAGQTLAQQDGLNVRASTLEAGDVILQHFVIDRLTGAEALEIGLYDRTDGHRFLANQSIDRVRLILK